MGDFKARIKAKFLRRHSGIPSAGSSKNSLSLGKDGAFSTHTHNDRSRSLTTGYAASDENSDNNHDGKISNTDEYRPHTHDATSVRSKSNSRSRRPTKASNAGKERDGGGDDVNADEEGHAGLVAGQGGQVGQVGQAQATPTETTPPPPPQPPLANSNTGNNPSPSQTTSTPGNDLHESAVNSTTAPTVTTPIATLALPSIHEHPANPNSSLSVPGNSSSYPTRPRSQPQHQFQSQPLPQVQPQSLLRPHPILTRPSGDGTSSLIEDDLYSPGLFTPGATTTSAGLTVPSSPNLTRPGAPPRRQSILPHRQTTLIKALLNSGHAHDLELTDPDHILPDISGNMVTRKIWVKRPLASATQVTISEDDLVDDVRDMILRKYGNSLGRQFDSPDLTLRICNREKQVSRTLQPDEPMCRTIDDMYGGAQTIEDAILIDIPSRRTPKASPNPRFYGEDRPHESGTDYFPPYPPAPHHAGPTAAATLNGTHTIHFPSSMQAIVGGGSLPPLPSPGGTRRLGPASRPKMQRMHTASPSSTVTNGHGPQPGAPPAGMHNYSKPARSRTHSQASSDHSQPPAAPPMPTPPPVEQTATPPPRVASPRPSARAKKTKKVVDHPSLPPGMLDGAVPPINVLIVEDNIINLKLLEAFVKRLRVRWQTAMNGREAVNKWRAGGFHLVLMDIQLPVMNGLDATREIRRVEKVNSIGVFSSSASSPPDEIQAEPSEEDKLINTEMFKSPVIIVALTASSLQSDRHEALAAGCNDFLTKPVNFVWLERKVKEWGCMQALIDFDGWRKWKDFSQKTDENDASKKAAAAKTKPAKKNRLAVAQAAA